MNCESVAIDSVMKSESVVIDSFAIVNNCTYDHM